MYTCIYIYVIYVYVGTYKMVLVWYWIGVPSILGRAAKRSFVY